MAGVKFYLEKRKDKSGNLVTDNVPILLFYSFNGQRLQYFTGERVDARYYIPEYWKNNGKDPVKKTAPQAEKINLNLDSLRIRVNNLHSEAKALSIVPTIEYFKKGLDEQFKGKVEKVDAVFTYDALQSFLKNVKAKFAYNTYRNTQTSINHIINFAGVVKLKKLLITSIDDDFAAGFKQYLIDAGHLNNTLSRNMAALRRFLNWCKEKPQRYITGYDIDFEIKENDIDVIFLDFNELQYLQSIKIDNPALDRIRDVFVFGCYTGMRYSDYSKLKKSNIKGDQLQFFITKGSLTTSQTIPLVKQSRVILEKYADIPGDKALPVISNQKMNDGLKDVMRLAEFNEIVTIAEKQGNGKVVEKTFEKWQLITCHTSRKTFITVSMTLGMPEVVIKAISGHKKDSKAFAKYYDVVDKLKKSEMSKIFEQ